MYSTERTLAEHGAKLGEADRKAIDEALAETREALKGEDLERIKRAQEALTKATHKLAEVMYRDASQPGNAGTPGGGPGPTAGQPSGPKEGEVVDAEFEDLGEKK